jgi:hypothetical protein
MKSKKKADIPVDLAARALFKADRTCCVCRVAGKPVQLHHIDEDPTHNAERNLAVLCLDCHTDTMVRGGFHRKLDADQVILYRDDWEQIVAQRRAAVDAQAASVGTERLAELKSLTTTLDILKERKQYWLLAIQYNALGNTDLRDKYIELTLQEQRDDDTLIFLRSMQDRQDLIPRDVIKREISRREKYKDWSQLARLYDKIGDYKNAVQFYCKSIIQDLEEDNVFAAAFYLKELCGTVPSRQLFEEAYRRSTEKGDLWWQIRALQELGWKDELRRVLMSHRTEIEQSGNSLLRQELYSAAGETEKLYEEQRRNAEGIRIKRVNPQE